MSDLPIHHLDQLLKELENNIGRLNLLMHQAFVMVETIREQCFMVDETYKKWCGTTKA